MSSDTTRVGRARGSAGLFVLFGVGIFVFAVLQAGLLELFLRQTSTLRILLPESGLAGLGTGAQVQLFGSPVGEVTRVVISPDEPFYAETQIDKAMQDFIRRDSRVVVRRQFGIAGAAFLDIARGQGEPLDWDYAVLDATVEQAPTEGIGVLVEEARERIFPLVEQATRTITLAGDLVDDLLDEGSDLKQMLARANEVSADIAAGEGTFGRLLKDDTLVRGLETTVGRLNAQIEALAPVVDDIARASGSAVTITQNVAAGTESLPQLLATLDTTLGSLDVVLGETARAMPAFQRTAEGAGRAVQTLPEVLQRTAQTLAQLEELLDALRRNWLLGGGGGSSTPPSATDVRP